MKRISITSSLKFQEKIEAKSEKEEQSNFTNVDKADNKKKINFLDMSV